MLEKLTENAVVAADDVAKLYFGETAGTGAQKTQNFPDESNAKVELEYASAI